jgi:hypothetical protein
VRAKSPAKSTCRRPRPIHIVAAISSADNLKLIPWTNPGLRNALHCFLKPTMAEHSLVLTLHFCSLFS